MCLPPINEDPRKHFIKLRDLAKKFNLNCLSMGMSGDYQIALRMWCYSYKNWHSYFW